jgi:hypothetical protein
MRFVFRSSIIALLSSAVVSAETCQTLCDSVDGCRDDPHEHGSYCKTWENPRVCFGLYWADEAQTQMCFFPNSAGDCPETRPVRCPEVEDRCQAMCNDNLSCANDPHAHGSYCKSWQNPSVCFGLYWTDATKTNTCFQPVDGESCSEDFPVECAGEAPVATTAAPVDPTTTSAATTTAAVGMRAHDDGLAGIPEVPTTAAPATTVAPATTTTRAPTTTTRAPTTTTRAPTTSTTTAAPTTSGVRQISGRYGGSLGPLNLEATLDPSTMRLNVVFRMAALVFPGNNLPYTFDGTNIRISPTPEAIAYLRGLPLPQEPHTVSLVYDAAADTITASFGGFRILGRKLA